MAIGAAGFAFGTALKYLAPFPAGSIILRSLSVVRAAPRVASFFLAGKDNKITKIISNTKERFPRITSFINSTYISFAIYGATLGYEFGPNIIGKITGKHGADASGVKPEEPTDVKSSSEEGTTQFKKLTDKTSKVGVSQSDRATEPNNGITIEKGDRLNVEGVNKGVAFDSSTRDKKVPIIQKYTNNVTVEDINDDKNQSHYD